MCHARCDCLLWGARLRITPGFSQSLSAPWHQCTEESGICVAATLPPYPPSMTVPWHRLPLTQLIHKNFWVVMSYAFATPVLSKWVSSRFHGEWKYLNKALFDMPISDANLGLLELATQLRLLDDHEDLSGYLRDDDHRGFGKVVKQDGSEETLYLRDMTNKVMHSASIEWKLDDPDNPVIVCNSDDDKRWVRAEIELRRLAAFIGMLMS